jgi:hypothetical protein
MINISNLKKKSHNTEYVGARIDPETKEWLELFCENNAISVSTLIAELIREFRKGQKDA